MLPQDPKKNRMEELEIKKIKLSSYARHDNTLGCYELDPTQEYIINLEEEFEYQASILSAFQIMGPPPAIKNYHAWLFTNGFDVEQPNPTNEFVSSYYGVKPLWKTDFSLGIAVKA